VLIVVGAQYSNSLNLFYGRFKISPGSCSRSLSGTDQSSVASEYTS